MKDTFNQEALLALMHFWETATGSWALLTLENQPAPAHAGEGQGRF